MATSPAEPAPGAAAPAPSSRLPGLDGLRGLAALVVVVSHAVLLSPVFQDVDASAGPTEPSWWFTHTPLSLLWAGPQAVFVFFVLSGFVLVLPVARRGPRGIRWRTYYPQRLVRLYVPVWGSLVLAVALAALVTRTPQPGLSDWYAGHVPTQDLTTTLRDAVLLLGTGWINSPLWSLRYEVLFSLLLPLYVAGALVWRRLWAPKLVLVLLGIGVAATLGMDQLTYLTMFALGALLAVSHEQIAAAVRRTSAAAHLRGRGTGAVLAVVAALMLTAEGTVFLLGQGPDALDDVARGAVRMLQLLGACIAVLLAAHWGPAVHALSLPSVQWVGSRSFSLYLVHEPVVVSSAALFPAAHLAVHVVVGLVVSLVLAEGFFRLVERPAQLLSRRVGRARALQPRLAPTA